MKDIKDILTSNDEFIENILYRFLWSNNSPEDKVKILSEVEQILDEIVKITANAKIQWLFSSHRKNIEYNILTDEIKSPDWSIIFCKDEMEEVL